jgi:hypothetical protein
MKKRNEEQWRALFAQQDASGVSAAVFCKQNELCPKYFSLRRKQLAKMAGKEETGFVRVKVKPNIPHEASGVKAASLTIRHHVGQLEFGTLPPPQWLAQLLRELA